MFFDRNLFPLRAVQRLDNTISIPVQEERHRISVRATRVDNPVNTTLIPTSRPYIKHVADVDDVRVPVGWHVDPLVGILIEDL